MDKNNEQQVTVENEETKQPYEAPMVLKKRSVSRVTLFSGGGVTAGGLTSSG